MRSDIPIFETPTERQLRETREAAAAEGIANRRFQRQQMITNWLLAGVGILTALFTGVQSFIANKSANTAKATLTEMQSGSGAQDTHRLAEQAERQAAETQQLAQSTAIQSKATEDLAKAALTQARNATRIRELAEARTIPDVRVLNMDLESPLIPGRRIRVINSFINNGESDAIDLTHRNVTEFRQRGTPPDYVFKTITGSSITVGAKQTYDSDIFIPPQTEQQLFELAIGERVLYQLGEIRFSDAFGRKHVVTYCMTLPPNSTGFVGCAKTK